MTKEDQQEQNYVLIYIKEIVDLNGKILINDHEKHYTFIIMWFISKLMKWLCFDNFICSDIWVQAQTLFCEIHSF